MSLMTKSSAILGFLASIAQVSAHGFVQGIDVDGTYYTGYLVNQYPFQTSPPESIGWTQSATDEGFVAPDAYASGDIICHKSATNAALTAPVAAGKTVRMDWNTWPESHHGPIIDYIANCHGDCATVDKTTLEFVKIAELGMISDTSSPGTWATDNLISGNNSWEITIPSTLALGNYVLRHEIIALHSAESSDGAQNYPQCINLAITGSGSDTPTGTLGEALYTETEAGVLVNIYTTGLDYTIPGPTLYVGGSSGAVATSAATVAPVTSASSAVPTTLVTATRSATSSAAAVQTSAAAAGEDDDTCEA